MKRAIEEKYLTRVSWSFVIPYFRRIYCVTKRSEKFIFPAKHVRDNWGVGYPRSVPEFDCPDWHCFDFGKFEIGINPLVWI